MVRFINSGYIEADTCGKAHLRGEVPKRVKSGQIICFFPVFHENNAKKQTKYLPTSQGERMEGHFQIAQFNKTYNVLIKHIKQLVVIDVGGSCSCPLSGFGSGLFMVRWWG